jgi:uncharacterized protein (TIGR02145 family)
MSVFQRYGREILPAALVLVAMAIGSAWLATRGKKSPEPALEFMSAMYGALVDNRDGKTYKTVKIGNQVWMAENLNYQTDSSWCYNNSDSYCEKYGRLYGWDAAMKACPAGWHLPAREEWDSLIFAASGVKNPFVITPTYWDSAGGKLKAKSGWYNNTYTLKNGNGTDDYGFSALPGGARIGGYFYNVRSFGEWWTATEDVGPGFANDRYMSNESNSVIGSESARGEEGHGTNKTRGQSVRCVMDVLSIRMEPSNENK